MEVDRKVITWFNSVDRKVYSVYKGTSLENKLKDFQSEVSVAYNSTETMTPMKERALVRVEELRSDINEIILEGTKDVCKRVRSEE